jgi:isochorismate hydrolase
LRPEKIPKRTGWEKKIPALTVPQMREVFARLRHRQPPKASQIAEEISRVLRRNEEARIYHWYTATGKFPPRRGQPDG